MEDVLAPAFQHLPGSRHVGHDVHLRSQLHQPTEELVYHSKRIYVIGHGRIQGRWRSVPNHPEGMGRRGRRDGRLHLPRPLPQGKALLVGLACCLEVEGVVIGQPQLHQRPRCSFIFLLLLQKRQRPLVVVNGLLVGVGQPGLVASAQQVLGRLLRLLRPLPVIGQQAHLLLDSLREQPLQRLGHLPVVDAPFLLQQAVVGRLLGQVVLEDVLQLRQPRPLADHLLPLQGQQLPVQVALLPGNGRQHAIEKDPPDDGRHLQHPFGLLLQAVNARYEHPVQRIRNRDVSHVSRRLPATGGLVLHDGAIVNQRTDDLFHVEGVALGTPEYALFELRRQIFYPQQVAHKHFALGAGEGVQPQVDVAMRVVSRGGCPQPPGAMVPLRAEDANEQQWNAVGQGQQSLQQLDRGGVGPVQVLADENQRTVAGGTLNQGLHGAEGAGLELLTLQITHCSFLFGFQRQPFDKLRT